MSVISACGGSRPRSAKKRSARLYRKFGFIAEGRHPKHIRRTSGELWDLVDMGLPLRS